ncbi:hypothetical protein XCR1_2690007 [Xenorhabdus cabanillasii JM26]|uniref:Uncharacterized protein n=1 Tax=Xenorhabdus cabanillasii JM26 TaxID=1427517 RepID=W1J7Q8_9GAMM|nr:hypothetical protein XCR1_2690007 [Xenorhabdus cabanillasii JM26]
MPSATTLLAVNYGVVTTYPIKLIALPFVRSLTHIGISQEPSPIDALFFNNYAY